MRTENTISLYYSCAEPQCPTSNTKNAKKIAVMTIPSSLHKSTGGTNQITKLLKYFQ